MVGWVREYEIADEQRERDEQRARAERNATIEECAKAIEDYHAGPQAVGKVLAGVIRKLKTEQT